MFTCKVRDQIFIPSRNSVQNGILNREPTWFNGSLTLNPSYSIMSVFKFFKLYKWYYVVQNSHINSQNVTQLTARAQLTIACSKSKIETLGKSVKYIQSFQHSCFPVNIAKFLRTPILKNIWQRLLLVIPWCHDISWKTRLHLNNIKKASISHIFLYAISALNINNFLICIELLTI